jgi:hypothetical protein
MAKTYVFAQTTYNTLADAQAAAASKKDEFERNPTQYARVKLLGGNETDGWQVPAEDLTDAEINALQSDDGNYYGVYSPFDGQMSVGLTSNETLTELARLKKLMGTLLGATKIVVQEEIETDIDMSDYTASE